MLFNIRLKKILFFFTISIWVVNYIGCSYEHTSPSETIEFTIRQNEIEDLIKIITFFAKKEGFHINNFSRSYPSGKKIIFFELNRDDGVQVKITDFLDGKRFVISIYKNDSNSWKIVSNKLASLLNEQWDVARKVQIKGSASLK